MDSPARLWARWTAATTAGEALGFAVPAAVGAAAFGLGVPDGAAVPLAVAAGAGEGAILGAAQALVLRRELRDLDRRDWIAATAAAAALCWGAGMSLGVFAEALPTVVVVAGWALAAPLLLTAIGTAQWLVLRRHVAGAGLWVPANAAAWLVGLPLPFAALALVDEDAPAGVVLAAGVVAGLGMGLVVAAVTGLALVRLLRR
jgi:hypothetical protein